MSNDLDTRFWKWIISEELTPPDPASGSEVLVMNTDSTEGDINFTDDTGIHTLTRLGSTRHVEAQAKFGNTSAIISGGIEVNSLAATDLGLSNQPFTIEAWVNPSSNTNGTFFSKAGSTNGWNSSTGIQYDFFRFNGTLRFEFWNGSSPVVVFGNFPITVGQWYHIAVTYNGSITRLFVDGSQVASTGGAYAKPSSANNVRIGISPVAGRSFDGYVDSIRVEKGNARYTSSFTPTEAPFTV